MTTTRIPALELSVGDLLEMTGRIYEITSFHNLELEMIIEIVLYTNDGCYPTRTLLLDYCDVIDIVK